MHEPMNIKKHNGLLLTKYKHFFTAQNTLKSLMDSLIPFGTKALNLSDRALQSRQWPL